MFSTRQEWFFQKLLGLFLLYSKNNTTRDEVLLSVCRASRGLFFFFFNFLVSSLRSCTTGNQNEWTTGKEAPLCSVLILRVQNIWEPQFAQLECLGLGKSKCGEGIFWDLYPTAPEHSDLSFSLSHFKNLFSSFFNWALAAVVSGAMDVLERFSHFVFSEFLLLKESLIASIIIFQPHSLMSHTGIPHFKAPSHRAPGKAVASSGS